MGLAQVAEVGKQCGIAGFHIVIVNVFQRSLQRKHLAHLGRGLSGSGMMPVQLRRCGKGIGADHLLHFVRLFFLGLLQQTVAQKMQPGI